MKLKDMTPAQRLAFLIWCYDQSVANKPDSTVASIANYELVKLKRKEDLLEYVKQNLADIDSLLAEAELILAFTPQWDVEESE